MKYLYFLIVAFIPISAFSDVYIDASSSTSQNVEIGTNRSIVVHFINVFKANSQHISGASTYSTRSITFNEILHQGGNILFSDEHTSPKVLEYATPLYQGTARIINFNVSANTSEQLSSLHYVVKITNTSTSAKSLCISVSPLALQEVTISRQQTTDYPLDLRAVGSETSYYYTRDTRTVNGRVIRDKSNIQVVWDGFETNRTGNGSLTGQLRGLIPQPSFNFPILSRNNRS